MTKKRPRVSSVPSSVHNFDDSTKLGVSARTSWKKLRIYYDEAAHRDFVTGFRRRKAERRAQAQRQQEEKERLQRVEEKREKRRVLMSLRGRFRGEMKEGDEEGTQEGRTVTEYGGVSVVVEKMETRGEREWRLMELREIGERATSADQHASESLKKRLFDGELGDAAIRREVIKMDKEQSKVKKGRKTITTGGRKLTKRRSRVIGSKNKIRSRRAGFRKKGTG